MKNLRLIVLAALAATAMTFALPSGAGAMPLFKYTVYELNQYDYHYVDDLVVDRKTVVRHVRGGVEQDIWQFQNTSAYWFDTTLQSGDEIQVYQVPLADPYPSAPYPAPTETFVVPTFTANFTAGSPIVTGSIAAGWDVRIAGDPVCGEGDSVAATIAAGAFTATFPFPFAAATDTRASATSQGDRVFLSGQIPGDAHCLDIDGYLGEDDSADPFEVRARGIDYDVIPTVRTTLSRGGALVASVDDDDLDLLASQRPIPGDVVNVYRPKDAAAPAFSMTIPPISGKFDPAVDLVAIDAPAARSVESWICRPVDCAGYSERSAFGTPAGRTLLDFKQGQSSDGPFDVKPDDLVTGWYQAPDSQFEYSWDIGAGDLVAPVGKPTLSKKLAIAKLKRKLKFKLNSSEAANATAKLTFKKVGKKGKKKVTKTLTIASLKKRPVVAGNNTLTLTISKRGEKLLKQMRKSTTAQLTVTLVDASGNASNVTKRTKLVVAKKKKS